MILWSKLPLWSISILRVAELIDYVKDFVKGLQVNPAKVLKLVISRAIIDMYLGGVGGDVVIDFMKCV